MKGKKKAAVNESESDRGFDVNERYSKKTDLEHVLLRPDTYVGGTDQIEREEWVWDREKSQVVQRKIRYSPALYKIFDEILVNARDHTIRDSTCNRIRVTIHPETGEITVENNGAGIPVEWHEAGDCYLAELIFGVFKTGENFSDDEKKIVGGRNGLGGKLVVSFSKRFQIETVDKFTGKQYRQLWENNMSVRHDPIITKSSKAGYTRVSFIPDYDRLGQSKPNDPDFISLLERRVYDMAACTREEVLIYFNGEKLNVRTFSKYVDLFLGSNKTVRPRVFSELPDQSSPPNPEMNWQVTVALSEDGGFKQFSMVNGIATTNGGTHVSYIRDQIVRKVGKLIREKNTKTDIKPGYIRENLWLFVNSVVVNPSFASQTKDALSTEPAKMGFKHNLDDEFVAAIEKRLQISKRAVGVAELRKESALKTTDGRKKKKLRGILKLEDAKEAGGRKSADCTLILTEGDSAKTMAMDGLQLLGRDYYGVFPLKGKFINARNASIDQLKKNTEYAALKEIMGLQENADYSESIQSLRYGCIMLLTDQDLDGFHIKGLIINLFAAKWPSLLKRPGFFKCFVTPIVRLQPMAANSRANPKLFFGMAEFEAYRRANPNGIRGMNVRYLKGLGSSESQEAREYFADFARFVKEYRPRDESLTSALDQLDHAFNNSFADWRKEWLSRYDENHTYDYKSPVFALEDYVDCELKHFSIYDNRRSLAHCLDGLKISQRKVLWSLRKIGLWTKTKKVLALAGEVSSASSYHHGEKSLMDTIVGMAQNFVGSNNVNLLYPAGQFGSRLGNGSDASDARYIHTRLSNITKLIYPQLDDAVLKYEQDDEGRYIEPRCFVPIISMVLVNGCQGIGTGYSTTIPMYNPIDVIDLHIQSLSGEDQPSQQLQPWYNNFAGTIVPVPDQAGQFDSTGFYERVDETTLRVTEVPVGMSFDGYKAFIESHLVENMPSGDAKVDKSKYFIKDYQSLTFPSKCDFILVFGSKAVLDELLADPHGPKGLLKRLRLQTRLSTRNMYLFDGDGAIRKFNSPEEIITYHRPIRLKLYADRKQYQLQELEKEIQALNRKRRFIELVLAGEIEVRGKPKQEVARQLIQFGLGGSAEEATEEGDDSDTVLTPAMKTLLRISLYDITAEEVAKFIDKIAVLRAEYAELEATPIERMWLNELQELRAAMVDFLKESSLENENIKIQKLQKKHAPKKKVVKKK